MRTSKVNIAVGDSQERQFKELDVTVNTGSTYTAVPRAMLNRMGDPGRKVATLRDCRRQHRPHRRRRSHHQFAAGPMNPRGRKWHRGHRVALLQPPTAPTTQTKRPTMGGSIEPHFLLP